MTVLSPAFRPSIKQIPVPTLLPDHALRFPEGDGEPLAESYEHVVSILDTFGVLKAWHTDDPTVRVGANNFIYYDENDKAARIAPDLFVVKDLPSPFRGSYVPWLHGGQIVAVIEFTSPSTRTEDRVDKFAIYQNQLKVSEYFLFDPRPEADQEKRLFGFRLVRGTYQPMPWNGDRLYSEELGMNLVVQAADLRLYHRATGIWLKTLEELQVALELSRRDGCGESKWAEAEAASRAQLERALEVERERARAAEAELERLRENRTRGLGAI